MKKKRSNAEKIFQKGARNYPESKRSAKTVKASKPKRPRKK